MSQFDIDLVIEEYDIELTATGSKGDPATNIVLSVNGYTGIINLTKADLGLGDVNNTADTDKPLSTAMINALAGKATVLNIPQYSVPYRNLTGSGEAHTNLLVASGAASAGTLAMRDANGAVFVANGTNNAHAVNLSQLNAGLALQLSLTGGTLTGLVSSTLASALAFAHTRASVLNSWGTSANGRFAVVSNGLTMLSLSTSGLSLGNNADNNAATQTLTMLSTSSGIGWHNLVDQTTNAEFARAYWNANVFNLSVARSGSGVNRGLRLSSFAGALQFNTDSAGDGVYLFDGVSAGSAGSTLARFRGTFTQSSGNNVFVRYMPTYNQSGTASSIDFVIDRTETALGSGDKLFIDFRRNGDRVFTIGNDGKVTAPNLTSTYVSALEPASPAVGDLWVVL